MSRWEKGHPCDVEWHGARRGRVKAGMEGIWVHHRSSELKLSRSSSARERHVRRSEADRFGSRRERQQNRQEVRNFATAASAPPDAGPFEMRREREDWREGAPCPSHRCRPDSEVWKEKRSISLHSLSVIIGQGCRGSSGGMCGMLMGNWRFKGVTVLGVLGVSLEELMCEKRARSHREGISGRFGGRWLRPPGNPSPGMALLRRPRCHA